MPHRFSGDPETLRSEKRKQILPADVLEREVLERLRYRETAIDYGAGTGYFTEVLARHFRRVYAIEAEWKMVDILKREMEQRGINNVGIILSDMPVSFDFDVDFILFSNVLHEVARPEEFAEWSSISKVVCVIDWKKTESGFGPPLSERIDESEMVNMFSRHFSHVISLDVYPHHYMLICYNEEDCLNKSDDESENRS